ncbi:MAG: hypothetical protein ACD_50C00297G0001 [uncultured bacterium]|nr:MAG: hypothetical protein ACD_50C00297G0001 [uncultured bacterium]
MAAGFLSFKALSFAPKPPQPVGILPDSKISPSKWLATTTNFTPPSLMILSSLEPPAAIDLNDTDFSGRGYNPLASPQASNAYNSVAALLADRCLLSSSPSLLWLSSRRLAGVITIFSANFVISRRNPSPYVIGL